MEYYRKKPVIIEAIEFSNFYSFVTMSGVWGESFDRIAEHSVIEGEHLIIRTLEGDRMANLGDFIIKGVQGEFYPCKPDIFEATYEAVDAPLATSEKE